MDGRGEKYHIDRVKAGDREAFTWIVDTYQTMLYTLCLRMLNNESDAEEAAQDIFVKAYRSINSFQERSRFSTWLYRITYNHCISVVRRKLKVIDLVDEGAGENIQEADISGLDVVSLEDRRKYLQLALEALGETDAVVVTLFYYEELSLEEIAKVTGLTNNNIRIKLHRSRKKMHQVLNELLKEEINSII
jgi:RNA polymerase sigma-70 factor (ECF subfamily)